MTDRDKPQQMPSVSAFASAGHTVVIVDGHGTQARCTCGWRGPDRTREECVSDEHLFPVESAAGCPLCARIRVALVVDDTSQHLHHEGLVCPEHQPPDWPCAVCA